MSDPNSAIPEHAKPQLWRRYEGWRAQLYERSLAKNAGRFPRLRNRKTYRRLVVGVVVSNGAMLVSAGIAFVSSTWFVIPFLLGLAGILGFETLLRIINGNVADAPISALDEIQLAQRNSARAIGFFVLFALMFIPYLALIFAGSSSNSVSGQTVYGIGILVIALVMVGACVPSILTSWWLSDPDPEDFDDQNDPGDPSASGLPETADESTIESAESDADAAAVDRSVRAAPHLDPPAPAPW